MKWLGALALVSLAACEQAAGQNPISTGGGGGTATGTTPDAATTSGDGGALSGKICLVASPPSITCATTGAGGLKVTLGNASVLTTDDGSFTLPSGASGPAWFITGTNIKTSVIVFGAPKLPAITLLAYQDMLNTTNAIELAGDGALMTRITRMGIPVAGATVLTSPGTGQPTYYDEPGALGWGTQETGALGVAWIPSLQPSNAQLTIKAGQTQKVVTDNLVFADAVTFVFAEIP